MVKRFKRIWWRITGQPTLAEYGKPVTITRTISLVRTGTHRDKLNTLGHK